MYWYLSFLRPPPVSISPTAESITITPQVANDLRTETRYEPTDVDYVWQCVSPAARAPLAPRPLTTFAPPASTYRPLDVPLPRVRPGERWRLGLVERVCAGAGGAPDLVGLTADGVGVVGAWSAGIEVRRDQAEGSGVVRGPAGGRGKAGRAGRGESQAGGAADGARGKGKEGKGRAKDDVAKQTRIQREWAVRAGEAGGADGVEEAGRPGGRTLRVVEQTSFDLDKKVWDSGLALASWLHRHLAGADNPPCPAPAGAATVLHDLATAACVVELGSGTGLVGIALGLLLPAARIYATDLELMRENIALNAVAAPDTTDTNGPASPAAGVIACELAWGTPLPADFDGAWPDAVVAADVTYNTASFPALVDTLDGLLAAGPGRADQRAPRAPRLLLAYKQRDAAERELWGLLAARGINLAHVDTVRGAADDGPVEVWVGERR